MTKQLTSRKGSFDSGHRVMDERMKCFNVHGHTYLFELFFEFNTMEDIGYNIDFKEIKRVGLSFIDNTLDHAMLLNPKDTDLINVCEKLNSKYWLMSLNGQDMYCNPTAENISKEIFLAMEVLFSVYEGLSIHKVVLYETPNCSSVCTRESISAIEREFFLYNRREMLEQYSKRVGVVEYDGRKTKQ